MDICSSDIRKSISRRKSGWMRLIYCIKPSYMHSLCQIERKKIEHDEAFAVDEMLEIYLRIYYKHARRKADAFLKHSLITKERHEELIKYFSDLKSEILLADMVTVGDRERKIDNADAFAWMAVKYLPDAPSIDLMFPLKS